MKEACLLFCGDDGCNGCRWGRCNCRTKDVSRQEVIAEMYVKSKVERLLTDYDNKRLNHNMYMYCAVDLWNKNVLIDVKLSRYTLSDVAKFRHGGLLVEWDKLLIMNELMKYVGAYSAYVIYLLSDGTLLASSVETMLFHEAAVWDVASRNKLSKYLELKHWNNLTGGDGLFVNKNCWNECCYCGGAVFGLEYHRGCRIKHLEGEKHEKKEKSLGIVV